MKAPFDSSVNPAAYYSTEDEAAVAKSTPDGRMWPARSRAYRGCEGSSNVAVVGAHAHCHLSRAYGQAMMPPSITRTFFQPFASRIRAAS